MKTLKVLLIVALMALAVSCGNDNIAVPPIDKKPDKEITPGPGIDLYGWVHNGGGEGIPDVVVSDGYSVVQTDSEGVYRITRHASSKYVHISVPSQYEIPTPTSDITYATFYKRSVSESSARVRADFELKLRTESSNNFTLFVSGDPQPDTEAHSIMFRDETVADMQGEMKKYRKPQIALALGDIVGKNDDGKMFDRMKEILGKIGIPTFVTIGNHDKSDGGKDMGELFSDIFGPLWYSFNLGQVHFVCLDNNMFDRPQGTCTLGISDEQIEWLEKDLAYVPRDNMLIVYYHIPMRNNVGDKNVRRFFELISQFPNVVTMCGHTHYFQPYHNTTYNIFERIHGGACGYFWRSKVGGDGAPNGYCIYEIEGNRIVNSRFKATAREDDYQIRLYRGNAQYDGGYTYDLGANYIVANVFYAGMDGADWIVGIYEDEVYSGRMTKMDHNYGDRWIRGYHIGVKGNGTSAVSPCYHQYQYVLKNPNAREIKVVATDSYGRTFSQDSFTDSYSYGEAIGY